MSGAIGSVLDYAGYGRLAQNASLVKTQLDQVTQQVSSGNVSDTYGGLGAGARVSLDLRPEITQAQTWQANIDQASTRLQSTGDVLKQLNDIANSFYTQVLSLSPTTASQVTTVAQQAQSALQQVAALLNTNTGGLYLFSGEDTSNPPVPGAQNILSSPFVTAIQSQVAGLTATNGASVVAATLAAAQAPANSPFSATIGPKAPQVEVGPGQSVQVGVIAGQNAYGTQSGPSTTGSYVLDLMRSLATLAALTPAQASLGQGFQTVLDDTRATLSGAMQAMTTDSAMLGSAQQSLSAQKTSLSQTVTVLTAQVSDVEDVDVVAASTRMSQLQAQLQASYRMIAGTGQLSLASYL